LPAGAHRAFAACAVNVRNGEMRYFGSRDEVVHLDHVLASGALPPAFPAIRIDGDPYWDGGIYSNTPIEAVLDDKPRRDSVIFTVHMWNPEGAEPETLWEVMGRQKEIQFARIKPKTSTSPPRESAPVGKPDSPIRSGCSNAHRGPGLSIRPKA
jgi:predicted acylesterase/phospholipase RssA